MAAGLSFILMLSDCGSVRVRRYYPSLSSPVT